MKSYAIETARLRLRPLAAQDLGAIHGIWVEPEVRRYLWDGERISREKAETVLASSIESFENYGFGIWAVILRENGDLIGFCGFRHLDGTPKIELIYGISTSYWGRGFATEGAKAAIRYGFEELGLERIVGIADTENIASRRVLEKVAMRLEQHTSHGG
jgi:RimJ/RimL family protein N-acetyltransferase